MNQALVLTGLAEGLLRVPEFPLLSLPFVVEIDPLSKKKVLISHFEKTRSDYAKAIAESPNLSVSFVAGFHYIDPTWIPRSPHAPTEIKAVFEIRGKTEIIERDRSQTLEMLQSVTRAKQELYTPNSSFSVPELPTSYVDRLLPLISEFCVQPEELVVSRLMVLQHLSPEERMAVIGKLEEQDSPCARAASRLMRMFSFSKNS